MFYSNLTSIDLALAAGGMGRELACAEITKSLIQNMFFTCDFCMLVPGCTGISCSILPSSCGVHTFCALTSSFYCQKHNYPPSLRWLLMLQNVCLEVTDQKCVLIQFLCSQFTAICTAEHNVCISHFHKCIPQNE